MRNLLPSPTRSLPTKHASALALTLAALTLALAACGSSSKSTTTSSSAASTSTTTPRTAGTTGSRTAHAAPSAMVSRACVEHHGVTVKLGSPNQVPSGAGRARFEAAIKACGGVVPNVSPPIKSGVIAGTLKRLNACIREKSAKLPPSQRSTAEVLAACRKQVAAEPSAAHTKTASTGK